MRVEWVELYFRPFFLYERKVMELAKSLSKTEQRYTDLSLKVIEECGLELYDLEFAAGSSTLRVFIRDPQTNSAEIDDCVKVDRAFSPYCEELEWIPDNFVLEVSSPGIYRGLKKLEHFEVANENGATLGKLN